MLIGIPKEIKNNENRVALTPAGVQSLVGHGHRVLIETNAGLGSGFTDADYEKQGAEIVATAAEAWAAELVVKVKEPLASEYQFLREDLLLFTYLHMAAAPELADAMLTAKTTGVAYETVRDTQGQLPLLVPMSEVAGRMAVQIGAHFLTKQAGGSGVLLGGVPGVPKGKVTIIGGGVVGTHAVPGAKAPKLVTDDMVQQMRPGSVIVDVAVDQGGVIATADRVTTHDEPVYEKHGVLHYAVANIPGAVARTSTIALTNVTLPYIEALAGKGFKKAISDDAGLREGVTTYQGTLTSQPVAEGLERDFTSISELV